MKLFLTLASVLAFCGLTDAQEMEQRPEKGQQSHSFALKELDAFHDILHPLVHDSYPEGDFKTIRAGVEDLLAKAVAIEKAKLPRKLAGRKKGFQRQSRELVVQLREMNEIKDIVDDRTFGLKFNDMHETFETIVNLLRE